MRAEDVRGKYQHEGGRAVFPRNCAEWIHVSQPGIVYVGTGTKITDHAHNGKYAIHLNGVTVVSDLTRVDADNLFAAFTAISVVGDWMDRQLPVPLFPLVGKCVSPHDDLFFHGLSVDGRHCTGIVKIPGWVANPSD